MCLRSAAASRGPLASGQTQVQRHGGCRRGGPQTKYRGCALPSAARSSRRMGASSRAQGVLERDARAAGAGCRDGRLRRQCRVQTAQHGGSQKASAEHLGWTRGCRRGNRLSPASLSPLRTQRLAQSPTCSHGTADGSTGCMLELSCACASSKRRRDTRERAERCASGLRGAKQTWERALRRRSVDASGHLRLLKTVVVATRSSTREGSRALRAPQASMGS
ncbi:hypothetical protein FA09DRAFT_194025 [Tilletiopsis washingtonensis]|jgi:hypothetical protein|uniref:Uncharacterized protein n=1 Tax=Tilletiopsis washingtonensis TaxID=58919 RepID=A0A316ZFW4_9BASI|nr:hypothetical protein FA09DRAFT_194025 [Tilletiopsis washingtonensis]PWO00631.1 hypothetical protein FA09DRAFT_194025 [Tilletiopsis washingtonensis]